MGDSGCLLRHSLSLSGSLSIPVYLSVCLSLSQFILWLRLTDVCSAPWVTFIITASERHCGGSEACPGFDPVTEEAKSFWGESTC